MILPLLLSAGLLVNISPTPDEILQSRKFEIKQHYCSFEIQASHRATDEPDEVIHIICDGHLILSRDEGDSDIGNISIEGDSPTLLVMRWERGTGTGITVISLEDTSGKMNAVALLEHWSKFGGESFRNGRVVFEHIGSRRIGKFFTPEATDVYRLQGGVYAFDASYQWNERAFPVNTLCILLSPQSCPATKKDKPTSSGGNGDLLLPMRSLPADMQHGPPVY